MTEISTVRSVEELAAKGLIRTVTPELKSLADRYAVGITSAMIDIIDPSDPNDPIAAQFVPSEKELCSAPEELVDPIGDFAHSPVEGIVHRYPDRALLKLLHTCPVYCRFCFRREQVGHKGGMLSAQGEKAALDYIRNHPEIWEVVLSGGDPLILSDRRLAEVMAALNAIDHVRVVRVHTRVPVVDPSRISPELVAALRGPKPVYILIHCNHARELTPDARAACARLAEAGFPLLSQSVLLRGVNDTVESLSALMRAFVESRIAPHYLHHMDLARGTGHFRVPIDEGLALLKKLRGTYSGLCQPSYILDIPGGHGKVPLGPVFADKKENVWEVEDVCGGKHAYKDLAAIK